MTQVHSHPHLPDLTRAAIRRMALSLGITLAFVFVEIAAGVAANSLALLTDAAHNFTDVLALGLSWWALRITTRPAHSGKTYGYHRAGILAALANSTTLAVIALGIFYEAYRRFAAPPEVQADLMIIVAAVAVVVNVVTALLIRRGSEHDLNLRSAFLHLMGDVLSTAGAVVAGIAIRFTGWDWLDPLVSVLIGFLILWNAWGIVRESIEILMEATPADIDIQALVDSIQAVEGVRGVHDLHVWSINQSLRTLSAHIVTEDVTVSQGAAIQAAVSGMLAGRYGVQHATLQLECVDCIPAELFCDITAESHPH
ncbi:MAG: cation transporter [Anaerolineales bacterium]|nr:cation transporter [Anaerolineales bacterium]